VERAGVSANAGKDFKIVAINQMNAPFGVQPHQFLHVLRIDAAMIAAGLPCLSGILAR